MKFPLQIVGLGPGDPGLITAEVWEVLNAARDVYLRTAQHPAVQGLPEHLACHAFDHLYETLEEYEAVYEAIVDELMKQAGEAGGVVYAVPGDPVVGEATVTRLLQVAAERNLPVSIHHGVSFIEPCLELAGWDALDGLQIADALDVAAAYHPAFHPDAPALIGQLYSQLVASDVKLTLMNQYPDEHGIVLLHAAGTSQASQEQVSLARLDHSPNIGSLTALFIPPLGRPSAFESFQTTVAHLRAPDGCPWDREQTHESLREHLLEEAYEVLGALDQGDLDALEEELGDLLLQIVLQAQIATEEGVFRMADVIARIQDKIIRRHPHVFGDLDIEDVREVLHNWEALKEAERNAAGEGKGLLDGVPQGLPALAQADEIQSRVARVGFDWTDLDSVRAKVEEELREVEQAESPREMEQEIGDLLFAVVNYARWREVDPEAALRKANRRFRRRFAAIERAARAEGRGLEELTLEEMEDLWESAKDDED